MVDIQQNLQFLQEKIASYAQQRADNSNNVRLLAVSKMQSVSQIEAAFQAGQQAFGENYLQEALEKITELSHLAIEWHFIGQIQSNKTALLARHFHWIQSVGSEKVLAKLNQHRPAELPPLNILLQVNISADDNKSGFAVDQLPSLYQKLSAYPRCCCRGLMTIPKQETASTLQENFVKMEQLFQQLQKIMSSADTLSMGMSQDYPLAIAHGSTLVRLGTALFGARLKG